MPLAFVLGHRAKSIPYRSLSSAPVCLEAAHSSEARSQGGPALRGRTGLLPPLFWTRITMKAACACWLGWLPLLPPGVPQPFHKDQARRHSRPSHSALTMPVMGHRCAAHGSLRQERPTIRHLLSVLMCLAFCLFKRRGIWGTCSPEKRGP